MIAIIPARGGSKGLPGKNIKPLLGKPLIAHTIEVALNSQVIDRVVVSTDDEEIANVAVKYGAEVPFMRPSNLASDTSKAIDAYIYTIGEIEKREGIEIENVCILLPTSPLRDSVDIDQAYTIFKNNNADSVVSYTKEHHPVSWHRIIDKDGRLLDNQVENSLLNRQDITETYFPNGSIYFFKTQLLRQGKYYTENSYAYVMPRNRSIDIDTQDDFDLAEFYLKKKYEKQTGL